MRGCRPVYAAVGVYMVGAQGRVSVALWVAVELPWGLTPTFPRPEDPVVGLQGFR